jgi:DNA helicase IV
MAALYERLPEDLDLELEEMADLVSDSAAYKMFLQAWWPDLTATDVLRRLGSERVVSRVSDGILDPAEQAALAASYDADEWTVADTALLDELVAMLGPIEEDENEEPLLFLGEETRTTEVITTADWLRDVRETDPNADPHDTFAHVLVDEAQDISPMQWRMLRRRGSQASWTIVGDPAQSSWPDLDESARSLQELIGSAPHRDFRLSTNYRSPAEVFTLAAEVVRRAYADADLPVAIRTTGVEPLLLTASEADLSAALDRQVAALAESVEGTIGVIAAPSRLASLSTTETGALRANAERIVFLSPLNAKGLEFDAVIVVGPDEIVAESPGGVRVLYVALTRPTQRLVTVDVGSPGAWREGLPNQG